MANYQRGSAKPRSAQGGGMENSVGEAQIPAPLHKVMSKMSYPKWWPETLKRGDMQVKFTFVVSVALTALLFIIGCADASYNNTDEDGFSGGSFALIWMLLLIIFLSAYEALVVLKWKSHLSAGILLGCVFMMCSTLFCVFVIFAGLASEDDGDAHHLDRSVAFFTFLLWIVYLIKFFVLYIYRAQLFGDDMQEPMLRSDPPPPKAKTSGGGRTSFGFSKKSSPRGPA
ncbi:unnamed protein product [Heterosigma akashiwo]|uniref:MARVEL domain-containing protein n=1 Tax=Heterosigma akashiwo TaxID=2829 RepID=A0A6V1NZT7_HETAK|mmetsp:Transcript_16841/g.23162  ORF Transcript_16841/g.23162 Transcript_16841/m.23162 type:complete len:228 (+) Transcript_16841:78-761(+)